MAGAASAVTKCGHGHDGQKLEIKSELSQSYQNAAAFIIS